MMKFIRQHMETIAGIEIYPLVSLCIFFLFFIGLIYYVFKLSKNYVHLMESLPFDNDEKYGN